MHAFVAFLQVDLHFPDVGSLKGKRAHLNRVKAWLRERAGASVAEVGHRDTWQRSTLAVAVVADSETSCTDRVQAVERHLRDYDVTVSCRTFSWADAEAIG